MTTHHQLLEAMHLTPADFSAIQNGTLPTAVADHIAMLYARQQLGYKQWAVMFGVAVFAALGMAGYYWTTEGFQFGIGALLVFAAGCFVMSGVTWWRYTQYPLFEDVVLAIETTEGPLRHLAAHNFREAKIKVGGVAVFPAYSEVLPLLEAKQWYRVYYVLNWAIALEVIEQ